MKNSTKFYLSLSSAALLGAASLAVLGYMPEGSLVPHAFGVIAMGGALLCIAIASACADIEGEKS